VAEKEKVIFFKCIQYYFIMTTEEKTPAFKVRIAGIEQMQETARSITETNKALTALASQKAISQMFDSSAIRQISRIQEDVQFLLRNIGPSLEIAEKFAKQQAAILESMRPTLQLAGIYQAQLNALASITKIRFPFFNLPELIRERQEFVHQSLEKELRNLDASYFKKWDGSWKAINSDNPDKVSQSANSIRELFTKITHDYSNDQQIMKEYSLAKKGDITRRQRLSFILKNSQAQKEDIDRIDNQIAFALELHEEMQKAVHSNYDEEKFQTLLYMYEGFIWMLIEQRLTAQ